MLGIGGCTLAEAARNLSAEEVATWAAYREQRGTLSLGLRLEQLFAASDVRAAQLAGVKKINIKDLLRYHDQAPPLDETQAILAAFGALSKQEKSA